MTRPEIAELEAVFSDLYDEPKTLEDIILDCVIMAPDMVRPYPNLRIPVVWEFMGCSEHRRRFS